MSLWTRRFTVDPGWRRHRTASGDIVTAGSPLRLFRFATGAAPILDHLERGAEIDDPTDDVERVIERLLAVGAVHPLVSPDHRPTHRISDVSVVIPTRDEDAESVARLVASLPPVRSVIIVDDGSTNALQAFPGATVIRVDHARGPAAARNTGARNVETDLILFMDADIVLPEEANDEWFWSPLLSHFDDQRVGIVAPRVASVPGTSVRERYEATDSPLDMGLEPALVRPGSRISYVPSAAVMMRTSCWRDSGGFDADLRYGEDVDLVWRVVARDVVCRYEPAVVVQHRPRDGWTELWRQRFHYGSSAAPLDQRHPGHVSPVRLSPWSGATWGLALIGRWGAAAFVTAMSTWRLHRTVTRSSSTPDIEVTLRLTERGLTLSGRALATAFARTWWPVLALMSTFSRRARRIWLASALVPVLWRRRDSELDPLQYLAAKASDDLAYGAGVWVGSLRSRQWGALLPRIADRQR